MAPERIWKCGGHPLRRENFFGHAPPLFWPRSTISRFGERFRDGQYSLASLLFAVLLLTVPPCPMESAPLFVAMLWVAVISHWHWWHWHGCSALHGLSHISVLCYLPPKNFFFSKTHRICISLKTGPGAGWGQLPHLPPPRDDAMSECTVSQGI